MSLPLQVVAILLVSLVAGATFGIWRGYDPSDYSPETFVTVHQGAVRGLNVLLPVMGAIAIVLTAALAILARDRAFAFWLYVLAAVLMVCAALVTRFGNQPINATIMGWSSATVPGDWTTLRDIWWKWHILRTGATVAAAVALVTAALVDRSAG